MMEQRRSYYFLGIGGIGMSALARFFNQRGDLVAGYDRTPSPLTDQLQAEGISIHFEDDPQQIPSHIDQIVYTPAVPTDTAEYQYLAASGIPMMKRSQMLGELTRGKKCIAVAGSHGKTTTSSMIAYLLHTSPLGCSAFLGGIAKNFDSNMVVDNKSEWVVVEADEYDRSFLQLHPYYSVITATDPDHLDIYGSHENLLQAFEQYASQTHPEGALFVKEGLFEDMHHHHEEHQHHHEETPAAASHSVDTPRPIHLPEGVKHHSYTAHGIEADYYAINVRHYRGNIYFDLRTPSRVLYDLQLTNSSLYNVENAVAASAVALSCGLDEYQLRHGLKTFAGIRRRFDYHINEKNIVYIDDYAHHPQEIKATLDSVRYLYPDHRIVGVFQPHLYTRTRDLAPQFAEVLSSLDELVMLDIYPAREKPIFGVSSKMILQRVKSMNKYLVEREQLANVVVALCPQVVVTMGAGDIDRLVPEVEQKLREAYVNNE